MRSQAKGHTETESLDLSALEATRSHSSTDSAIANGDANASREPKILDKWVALKSRSETIGSLVSTIIKVTALIGTVWVALEAMALPDGIPQYDAATFASLATAVAVAGAMILSVVAFSLSGAGLGVDGYRSASDPYVRPGKRSLIQTTYALTLGVSSYVVLSLPTILNLIHSAWHQFLPPVLPGSILLAIPGLTIIAILFAAEYARPRDRIRMLQDFRVVWTTAKGSFMWMVSLLVVLQLTEIVVQPMKKPSPLILLVVLFAFMTVAVVATYLASMRKLVPAFIVGLLGLGLTSLYNPSAMRGAPFRALKLIDIDRVVVMPGKSEERTQFKSLLDNCSAITAVGNGSYKVHIVQRISSVWTITCRDGMSTSVPGELLSTEIVPASGEQRASKFRLPRKKNTAPH